MSTAEAIDNIKYFIFTDAVLGKITGGSSKPMSGMGDMLHIL